MSLGPNGNIGSSTSQTPLTMWAVAGVLSLALHGVGLYAFQGIPLNTGGMDNSAVAIEVVMAEPAVVAPENTAPAAPRSIQQDETSPTRHDAKDDDSDRADRPDRSNRNSETVTQQSNNAADTRIAPSPVVEATLPAPAPPKASLPRSSARNRIDRQKRAAQIHNNAASPEQSGGRKQEPQAFAKAAPGPSMASWQSAVRTHIQRHVRSTSTSGTATVRIAINGSGSVLSVSMVRSSGNPVLDAEAIALPRRASPLPAPPTGIGPTVTFSSPVTFHYRP